MNLMRVIFKFRWEKKVAIMGVEKDGPWAHSSVEKGKKTLSSKNKDNCKILPTEGKQQQSFSALFIREGEDTFPSYHVPQDREKKERNKPLERKEKKKQTPDRACFKEPSSVLGMKLRIPVRHDSTRGKDVP